ncbi:MAG: type II toxin-antitoxin system VapC family toxin [Candidatus Dormibacteraeota bacterium]|uniref:Ribonuclease VapC n=1 Tax=Candidatus Amunia macphersoniae TaxID=3127014 RepID=A0A934KM93_9BACT|nr:type II toxin-antitoxin system VapC family toxin [Candidatus Dormibacteraeota bacterium]
MTVVDANVLLYAVNADDPTHVPARRWLESALGSAESVAFSWVVILAFLRMATSSRVFGTPLTAPEATAYVEEWLRQPAAVVISPTSRHLAILSGLLAQTGSAGNLITDAHLAALAVEHGARLASFDRDFLRFARHPIDHPERPDLSRRRAPLL